MRGYQRYFEAWSENVELVFKYANAGARPTSVAYSVFKNGKSALSDVFIN